MKRKSLIPFLFRICISSVCLFSGHVLPSKGQAPADSLQFGPVEIRADRIVPSEPYRVTQVDSSTLRENAFQDLGALLEENSALQVRHYGPSGTSSLSFRGTRSNETRMYWNGLPLRSPTLGQTDLSLIPVFFLDRVELHHGGASAVDGSGGIGGSVQLNSGIERSLPWRLRIQGRAASFGERMGGIDYTENEGAFGSRTRLFYRSAANDFSYTDITEKGNPEKERKNAGIRRMGGMQDFHYTLGKGHRVFAKGWYLRSSRDVPTPIDQVERGQHQEDQKLNSMLGWRWNGPATQLSLRSGYFSSDQIFQEEISDLRSVTRTRSWRSRFQAEHRLDEKRRLSGALAHEVETARSSGYSEKKQRDYVRGHIQFENRFGERLLLQGLLQEQWVDGERVPLMPTLGADLEWMRDPDLHWKANVSRTYRVPTLNDLYWEPGGDPQLLPQEGWSYETGLSGHFGKKKEGDEFRAELTAFFLEMDDRIVWAPTSKGYWSPKNIDRSRDKGVEASLSGRFLLWEELTLRWRTDYSYVDAQVVDQVEEEAPLKGQAIYVPHHRGSGSLRIIYREKNSLGYGISHTGERFVDRDNQRYLPAYTLQRVHFERQLAFRNDLLLKVRAGVRNLFDIPYHSVAWHPMPGRSFELDLRLMIGP